MARSTAGKTLRAGSTVMMLRPYAVDSQDPASPSIARGANVRIVDVRRTAFGTRIYDVTNGVVTIFGIPRHAIAPSTAVAREKTPTADDWSRAERRAARKPSACSKCGDISHRLPQCPRLGDGRL